MLEARRLMLAAGCWLRDMSEPPKQSNRKYGEMPDRDGPEKLERAESVFRRFAGSLQLQLDRFITLAVRCPPLAAVMRIHEQVSSPQTFSIWHQQDRIQAHTAYIQIPVLRDALDLCFAWQPGPSCDFA